MDLAKSTDFGEYLIEQLRTEVHTYKILKPEQGIAIPKMYGAGMMSDMIIGEMFLEYAGGCLEDEYISYGCM